MGITGSEYAARWFESGRYNDRRRWLTDPAGWAATHVDMGPGGLTGYQADALARLVARGRVAIRSPHGTGKTAAAALAVLWFALTREQAGRDWKVITTASAWRQLTLFLWPEIHKWAGRLRWDLLGRRPFDGRRELLTLQLQGKHGLAAAVASDEPARVEGAHADSLLYILDEAKTIPGGLWDAVEGAFSGGRLGGYPQPEAFALAVSTPGAPAGRFYDIHARRVGLADWDTVHITLEQAVAAGRINPDWARARAIQWGETSAIFHNRVLGEFHAGDEDSVVPLAWAEAAVERWRAWDEAGRPDVPGLRLVGVDVARSGADQTVVAHRAGHVIGGLDVYARQDTMATTARVQATLEQDAELAVVDSAGIGAGVVDRLRELGLPVFAYTGAAKTAERDRSGTWGFVNCLTGDARVRPIGRLLRIYRSRHEGPLLKIEMASGDHFTATPNHQVLTPRGWVSVQSLSVGDQLCDTALRDATVAPTIRPEVDNVPPELGEIYGAAHRLFGTERMQRGTVNFHGDVPVGDVDVVTVDRDLLSVYPPDGQASEDAALVRALLGESELSGECRLAETFSEVSREARVASAFPSDSMATRPCGSLLDGEAIRYEVVGLGAVPALDAVIGQNVADEMVTGVIHLSKRFNGFSGEIPSDHFRTVNPGRSTRAGHVALSAKCDIVLQQNAPHDILVQAQTDTESVHRFSSTITRNQRLLIESCRCDSQPRRDGMSSWLDAVLAQRLEQGSPVSAVEVAQRLQRCAIYIPLNEIVSIKPATDALHGSPYVYTLETTTGSYRTQNTAHRNCRSAAYWRVRELLDPAFDPVLALPPDEQLLADLCAPTWAERTGLPPRIQVEPKEQLVDRLGRSPDRGDAVVMALWAKPPAPADVSSVAVFAGRGSLRAPHPVALSPFPGARGRSAWTG